MKVGFAGRWDPLAKSSWSGTYYYAYHAIKKHHEVEVFQYKWPWHVRESLILHKQVQKIKNKKIAVEFLKGYAKYFSKQLEKELLNRRIDVIFAPAAPQLIAYCKTTIPVIFMTDATFQQIQGYYHSFDKLAAYNIHQGVELDRKAFEKASHCMLASEWTKQSAINDYHIPAEKITVAPLGANLDSVPTGNELKKQKNNICRLLFLGVEWERKGGQIALDTLYTLRKNGVDAELTIIGCVPPMPLNDNGIKVIPFLNKHDREQSETLYSILRNADFLLLPTRAECAGVVFCEASAFGVPSITTDTGRVTTYVKDGVNGFALPLAATGEQYATLIQQLFATDDVYMQLSQSSRNYYEERLNWDTWGKTFNQIAQNLKGK